MFLCRSLKSGSSFIPTNIFGPAEMEKCFGNHMLVMPSLVLKLYKHSPPCIFPLYFAFGNSTVFKLFLSVVSPLDSRNEATFCTCAFNCCRRFHLLVDIHVVGTNNKNVKNPKESCEVGTIQTFHQYSYIFRSW